jgi:hypothetical protein
MRVRDLLPDPTGTTFLVLDGDLQIYLVTPSAKTRLGATPELGKLIAAWHGSNGWAFARKREQGEGYEIVGVGHEGSRVLATAKGYPGAMRFVGEELHFIDSEGWKAVSWGGEPVLKARMDLGMRSNQTAWCAWLADGPRCAAGYWDGGRGDDDGMLSVVLPTGEKVAIASRGIHPILASAAFSRDGRMLAAVLGARSAGADSHGRVTVAWLDEAGRPTKERDFPLIARSVYFDDTGRLIVESFPKNDFREGELLFLDPDTGATRPVMEQPLRGYSVIAGKHIYLIGIEGAVNLIELP